jgi:hypothetical protein
MFRDSESRTRFGLHFNGRSGSVGLCLCDATGSGRLCLNHLEGIGSSIHLNPVRIDSNQSIDITMDSADNPHIQVRGKDRVPLFDVPPKE